MRVFQFITLVAGLISLCSAAIPPNAKLTRPPSFPLAVRNPYTNFWLPANELPGNWPCFWTGGTKGWTGIVRVDNTNYVYLGNPQFQNRQLARQTFTAITPTQTIFGINAGPVSLNVTFFSPVEHSDIQKQSIPLSYVFVDVASNDGSAHNVQLYMDISGEWATADTGALIKWAVNTTQGEGLKVWSTSLQTEYQYGEHNDYPTWGRAILAASPNATHASGADTEVRGKFLSTGALDNTNDENFRCAACDWPTFAFANNLGQVSASSQRIQYVVGLVREDNANFLGEPKKALWVDYWGTFDSMLNFFWNDINNALTTADALDMRILSDATASGGQSYADILAMSLRQAYAGNEFAGTKEDPLYYQKEISSGGFMQTVDVIYPATPMFYYLNITYLKLLLDPLFYQMENGVWTRPFAMHDIGGRFPNATGQGYGGDMPVEESGNMLMMVADIIFHPDTPVEEARSYGQKHYPILSVWADYLLNNCLYPVDQLSTDDFIGPTELNSGLALKGILAMAAFARISTFLGNTTQAQLYNDAVKSFVPIWINESMHVDRDHLKMEYNVTNGYQFKYNAWHDKLLNLSVVPEEIYKLEADYYLTKLEPYGIPFVSTHDYTKSDWEMWTAAAFGHANPALKTSLIETLGKFLQVTAQRIPFTDWYVTATANHAGFQARPVLGGHFAILALEMAQKQL